MNKKFHFHISLLTLLLCLWFIKTYYPSGEVWSVQNYLAGAFSSGMIFICLLIFLIGRPGFTSFAIFNLTWHLALLLNRAYISSLQFIWPLDTLLYIMVVPTLCSICLISFSNHPFHGIDTQRDAGVDRLALGITLLGFSFLCVEMAFFPIPVLQDRMSEARLEFGFMGGFHVAGESFLRLGTILAIGSGLVHGFRKINKLACGIAFLMATLLVSRSLMIELVFIGCFVKLLCQKDIKPSLIIRSAIFIFIVVFAFSTLGNIREGDDFDIKDYSESKLQSPTLNWLFAYFAINYDNLATILINEDYRYNPSFTLGSILGVFGLKGSWYDESYDYIGKLNLGTGFRDYLMDYGPFWGPLILSLYFFIAARLFSRSSWRVPGIATKALVVYGIAFFPMVNRFSGIPYLFSLLGTYIVDRRTRPRRSFQSNPSKETTRLDGLDPGQLSQGHT